MSGAFELAGQLRRIVLTAAWVGGCWLLALGRPRAAGSPGAPCRQPKGRFVVAGASAPVEIVRDRWAIPHIKAASIEDGYFALGFVHAQDRLWQMELRRRAAQGRLAEVVGARRCRWTASCGRSGSTAGRGFDRLSSADARRDLEAYARGVNAFLAAGAGRCRPSS